MGLKQQGLLQWSLAPLVAAAGVRPGIEQHAKGLRARLPDRRSDRTPKLVKHAVQQRAAVTSVPREPRIDVQPQIDGHVLQYGRVEEG